MKALNRYDTLAQEQEVYSDEKTKDCNPGDRSKCKELYQCCLCGGYGTHRDFCADRSG